MPYPMPMKHWGSESVTQFCNAIREFSHDHGDILLKPCRTVGIQPAAAKEKVIRIVPVKQCDPGCDAGGEQLVDESVVEIEPLFIYRARSCGEDAWPGNGESIRIQADLREEGHVLLIASIVIAGFPSRVPFSHMLTGAGEHIPDGGPLPSAFQEPSI